jgi:integrase
MERDLELGSSGDRGRPPQQNLSVCPGAKPVPEALFAANKGGWLTRRLPLVPTPPGHIELVELVTPFLGVRPVCKKKYSYCLRRIACDLAGLNDDGEKKYDPAHKPWQDKADRIKLSILSPLAIEGWKASLLKKAGASPADQLAARRNVNCFVRNARSLFGKKVQRRIKELGLPDFENPFHGVQLENQGGMRYVSTVNAAELLKKARQDLSQKDPESWKVILLALGAGPRRAEIDGLCVPQLVFSRALIQVAPHDRFEVKTDESIGVVHVDIALLEELKKHIDPSSPFVVEPNTPAAKGERAPGYYRCDDRFTRVTKWLRDNGVREGRPLHVLRKEFRSIVNAQSDIHTASSQLRHGSIATTAAFYADNRRRSPVPIGDMLRAEEKETAKTGTAK